MTAIKNLVFIILIVITKVLAQDSLEVNPRAFCYSLNCPPNTTVCGKVSEVSKTDKSKLDVQIRCYNDQGTILDTHNTTEVNHFGPDVYYKGTKLSAVVRVPPQPENDDFGWANKYVPLYKVFYPDTTTQKDVPKVEEILPEDDSAPNPKSEVEDLNN